MRLPEQWKRERAASLMVLGMRNYAEYLASPLWARIRRRVYRRAEGLCETKGCSSKATAIHHWSYALKVMNGSTLKSLQAVCEACHLRHHGIGNRKPKGPDPRRERRRAFRALVAAGGAIKMPSTATPRLIRKIVA